LIGVVLEAMASGKAPVERRIRRRMIKKKKHHIDGVYNAIKLKS
jgi:hypothetical protein